MGLFDLSCSMSLVVPEGEFQLVRRILNTNVDGRRRVMFALTGIKGIGLRFSDQICKRAEIDLNKRAGQLTVAEIEKIVEVIQNPLQFGIPKWFLNRQKNLSDNAYTQLFANNLDMTLREDLTRLRKTELIVVFATTSDSVSVVNTQRPLADVERPSVWPRR